MAKYILNYTGSRKSVNCAILDENYIANTYTVRFNNGTIKDVSKRRVVDLDHIDEAVLDKLKSVGARLWDNIVKAGKYIYFRIRGKRVNVVSPINTMAAAQTVDGLSFYPSQTLADVAEDNGIQPVITHDESENEDLDMIKDINSFWENVIRDYKNDKEPAYESISHRRYKRFHKIHEASDRDIVLEHPSFPNVNTVELTQMILTAYGKMLSGVKKGDRVPEPLCIWGAPGIGKTQIIRGIINDIREAGIDANIISVNAQSMRKDDWSLPSIEKNSIVVTDKTGAKREIDNTRAADRPKDWLPVYDLKDIDPEHGITEEVLDNIANGGDDNTVGQGGFFFIDELSRIDPSVTNVIMTLIQSREYNGFKIGSKWMFIGAANRSKDLSNFGDRQFSWDSAQAQRFGHVNFVPTFKEWLEWAESPIGDTNTPHVLPEITEFLKANKEVWYAYSLKNDEDPKSKEGNLLYPNPRSWEQVSSDIRNTGEMRSKWKEDPDSPISKVLMKRGINPKNLDEPDTLDITTSIRKYAGNKAANLYKDWSRFDSIFTTRDAKRVWERGDAVDVNFPVDAGTLERAIIKIFENGPKDEEPNPYWNGGRVGSIEISRAKYRTVLNEHEFDNILKFIIKCLNNVDKSAVSSVANVVKLKISNILRSSKYAIDIPHIKKLPKDMDQETYDALVEHDENILFDLEKTFDTFTNSIKKNLADKFNNSDQ